MNVLSRLTGIGAAASVTLGLLETRNTKEFLELLGFPHVSMLWVNLLGWSVFNVQMLFVILRSR